MMHNYSSALRKQTPSTLLKSHQPLVLKYLMLLLHCVVLLKPPCHCSSTLHCCSHISPYVAAASTLLCICIALLLRAFKYAFSSSMIYAPTASLVPLLSQGSHSSDVIQEMICSRISPLSIASLQIHFAPLSWFMSAHGCIIF